MRLLVPGIAVGFLLTCCLSAVAVTPAVPSPVFFPTLSANPFQIHLDDVVVGETVLITLTVRSSGSAALLFDTPTLDGGYPTPESLEQARFDLLDLATGGRAQITLEFPRPAGGPPWTLVFNPLHTPENQVAPRIEVEVEEE